MKKIVFLLLAMSLVAAAEQPNQWGGAFVQFNQYAAPQINGGLAYAKKIISGSHPTYSFTAVNFLSVQKNPFRLMASTETGVAQHVTKFGKFDVYGIGTIGLAAAGEADGTATGAAFSGGGLALAGIGRGWSIGPIVRVQKTTISEVQWSAGVVVGWGGE